MAIDWTIPFFPNNVVTMLADEMASIDSGLRVFKRPIRTTDSTESLSIFPLLAVPDMDSLEMTGGPFEPTLQDYTIAIEALIVDGDEERGLAAHAVLSTLARLKVYRSTPLAVGLRALKVEYGGRRETLKKFGVSQQVFMNNRVDNNFVFLSTMEFYFQTETEEM